MAYPGEGYKMSNYGSKWYTPTQEKEQWTESVKSEKRVHDDHLATKKATEEEEKARQSATAAGSTLLVDSPTNYFNHTREHPSGFMYDRMFQVTEGYNQQAKRDDRAHFGHKMDLQAEVPLQMDLNLRHQNCLRYPQCHDHIFIGWGHGMVDCERFWCARNQQKLCQLCPRQFMANDCHLKHPHANMSVWKL